MSTKYKKLLILNLPYVIIGLLATNVGEIWRMAVGENAWSRSWHLGCN